MKRNETYYILALLIAVTIVVFRAEILFYPFFIVIAGGVLYQNAWFEVCAILWEISGGLVAAMQFEGELVVAISAFCFACSVATWVLVHRRRARFFPAISS